MIKQLKWELNTLYLYFKVKWIWIRRGELRKRKAKSYRTYRQDRRIVYMKTSKRGGHIRAQKAEKERLLPDAGRANPSTNDTL